MWENLNTNPNPEIMAAFEDVLAKLTGDLERKTAEQEDFENALKNRHKSQEEHLQVLYEEMEQQIQRERKVIRAEEEQREKRTRKELEAVLEMKDAQVNGLLLKQKTMQVRTQTHDLDTTYLPLAMDSGSKSRVGYGYGKSQVFPPVFQGFVTKIHVELGFGYHFLWSGLVRIAKRSGFFPRVF